MIDQIWLPAAIRYRIPYDIFWKMNPKILTIYQDAYIQNKEEEYKSADYRAWLEGAYILRSIQCALSPKKIKYYEKPFTAEEKSTLSDEEKFLLWVEEFNRRFEEQTADE